MLKATYASREKIFSFGGFHLIPERRLLAKGGRPVKLGSRALDLLVVLVENAGSVVAKGELMMQVWGSVVVEETNLRVHISVPPASAGR
jgi:DNA-binding winged helix-turn-helix (wHTH) protein